MTQSAKIAVGALQSWRPVIGLEVHAQLQTRSKMFSRASFDDEAGSNCSVSQFDMAAPGTLPVLNRSAVLLGVKAGVLLNCIIPRKSRFERKHYFYADMPAGYQITQQRNPVAHSGHFDFYTCSSDKRFVSYRKRLRISRIQLEIDSGRTLHDLAHNRSLVDLNRAGVGLIEIVSEPDLSSALEGACCAEQLCMLLAHNGICGGLMHRGQFRVDANISLCPVGSSELGVRTEVKNLNSLKAVHSAINYEIARQYEILKDGGVVVNETRTVDDQGRTVPMRDKEVETDYRFLPEANLPSVVIHREWISGATTSIDWKLDYLRFIEDYGMEAYNAIQISKDSDLSQFVKLILCNCDSPVDDVLVWLDELKMACDKYKIKFPYTRMNFDRYFIVIINMQYQKRITRHTAVQMIRDYLEGKLSADPETAVSSAKLWRLVDNDEISQFVTEVFKKHTNVVAKAAATLRTKHLNKLRNEVIIASGKRIDLQDAADAVLKMLETMRTERS